ncbi:MAG: hypothetical protein V4565_02675 [Bacteroidota bacterium]
MEKEILMAVMIVGLLSCKKKASPVNLESGISDPCFNSHYNGAYHGHGSSSSNAFSLGNLTISKTGCESCSIYLTTNTGGTYSDNITQLVSKSSGGFEGKSSNGNNVSIVLGSHLDVIATGSYTFTGQK